MMQLICYLSNGYPTLDASRQMAKHYADAGCDAIEVDFPSQHPFLENDLIAGRMKKALKNCDDYHAYMVEMAQIKEELPQVNFILMVYENTVEEIGIDRFIQFCLKNKFMDIILVGIKDERVKARLIERKLRVSCYVQFQLIESEIDQAIHSNGFVYLQAKPAHGLNHLRFSELKDCINYLRDRGIQRPIYCGVGIHTAEDVRMVKQAGADGVFVGSTILKLHDRLHALRKKIQELKEASM